MFPTLIPSAHLCCTYCPLSHLMLSSPKHIAFCHTLCFISLHILFTVISFELHPCIFCPVISFPYSFPAHASSYHILAFLTCIYFPLSHFIHFFYLAHTDCCHTLCLPFSHILPTVIPFAPLPLYKLPNVILLPAPTANCHIFLTPPLHIPPTVMLSTFLVHILHNLCTLPPANPFPNRLTGKTHHYFDVKCRGYGCS